MNATHSFVAILISILLLKFVQSRPENTNHDDTKLMIDVFRGVQGALDECRKKFMFDRWNCPKKVFEEILHPLDVPLPTNKELGFARSLVAASIVLSVSNACNSGNSSGCGCSSTKVTKSFTSSIRKVDETVDENLLQASNQQTNWTSTEYAKVEPFENVTQAMHIWKGCDESIAFGFEVSKVYLDNQDYDKSEVQRMTNAHNYEIGRLAVKKQMRKQCKCHGMSASCQVKTCWTRVPTTEEVLNSLVKLYRRAAKVGGRTANETNPGDLKKELNTLKEEKLVFIESSPDYCYEHQALGINGTLGRNCSTSNNSCDRLCTKCGYRIKKYRVPVEKSCKCKFQFCCTLHCEKCTQIQERYKCVRHS